MSKDEEIIELKLEVVGLRDDLKESQAEVSNLGEELSDAEDEAEVNNTAAGKLERYEDYDTIIDKLEESKVDLNNMMQGMKMEWILDNWNDISFDVREGCNFSVNKS